MAFSIEFGNDAKEQYGSESLDFFDNSVKQIELIELLKHISTETVIVI